MTRIPSPPRPSATDLPDVAWTRSLPSRPSYGAGWELIVRVISFSVLGIVVASLVLLGFVALFVSIARAQPVYVPPGVVFDPPRHNYVHPSPYCDRDCQWRRYHRQREYDREYRYEHRWDWR